MARFLLIAGIFAVVDFWEFKRSKLWREMWIYCVFMAIVIAAGVFYAI